MKKGQFILSAAAVIMTVASALAFKPAAKRTNILFTKSTPAGCQPISCWTAEGGAGLGCNLTVAVYTTIACATAFTGPITLAQ